MGKLVVINISLGTYLGSHEGQDLQAKLFGGLISAQPGRSVVCAAGNAGIAKLHFGYNVPADIAFTWLNTSFGSPYCDEYGGIFRATADMNNIELSTDADDKVNYTDRYGTPLSSEP